MPKITILNRSEPAPGTALSRALATVKSAVKVLLVLVAMALPIALASPAQATTTATNAVGNATGCTMKVFTPQNGGTDFFTGTKLVTYKVKVSCPLGFPKFVQVQQKFYDGSTKVGPTKTSFQLLIVGGSHTFSVTDKLPNLRSGPEPMSQKARFFAVANLPVPAGTNYGPWVTSGTALLSN